MAKKKTNRKFLAWCFASGACSNKNGGVSINKGKLKTASTTKGLSKSKDGTLSVNNDFYKIKSATKQKQILDKMQLHNSKTKKGKSIVKLRERHKQSFIEGSIRKANEQSKEFNRQIVSKINRSGRLSHSQKKRAISELRGNF